MKRCYSLKRNKEFVRVYKSGKSVVCKSLVLTYRKTGSVGVKIGFSVSKRIGNSVVRNKVKRRLRAAVAPLILSMKPGFSMIFIARSPVLFEKFADIEKSLITLLKKASVLDKER